MAGFGAPEGGVGRQARGRGLCQPRRTRRCGPAQAIIIFLPRESPTATVERFSRALVSAPTSCRRTSPAGRMRN